MTDFIKKTVVQNAENVQTGRLVTKLMELVKMVVVQRFYLLFAKNASVVIMGKPVTKRVHTATQAHLAAVDTMVIVFLDVKMEVILPTVDLYV